MEAEQQTRSSYGIKGNPPIILPRNATKKLKEKIKQETSKSKRIY